MYSKYHKLKQIRNALNLTSEIGGKRFGFSKTFAQNVRCFVEDPDLVPFTTV